MRFRSLPPVVLSLLLQLLPVVRVVAADAALAAAPILAVLRLIAGATAVAGSLHAVSGASITVTQPPNIQVTRTNGVASSFRVNLTYSDGRTVLTPQLYTAENLPPGFDQPSRSGGIWRITGNPTQSGVFEDVRLTGWKTATADPEFSATVLLKIIVVDRAPIISTQPTNLTAEVGSSATLRVVATGGNLTYQWRKGDLQLTGETSDQLTFDPVTSENAGTYQVFVQNSGGGILSNPATLTVTGGTEKPTFTTVPQGKTVHAGENVSLISAATGPGPLNFRWFRANEPVGGGTSEQLSFLPITLGDAGSYTVAVTGAGGTTTSEPAQLTVAAPLSIAAITVEGAQVRIVYNGIAGRQYQLEGTSGLIDLEWLPLVQGIVASEGMFTSPLEESSVKMYRVRVL